MISRIIVLEAMKKSGKPVRPSDIAKDSKKYLIKELRSEGKIQSSKRV